MRPWLKDALSRVLSLRTAPLSVYLSLAVVWEFGSPGFLSQIIPAPYPLDESAPKLSAMFWDEANCLHYTVNVR